MSGSVELQDPATEMVDAEFPSVGDFEEILLLNSESLWNRLSSWEGRGVAAADITASEIALFSICRVVQKKHPWKSNYIVKTVKSGLDAFVDICDHTEEGVIGRKTYPYRSQFRGSMLNKSTEFFKMFLTENLRMESVRQHARGMSTGNVVRYLLSPVCEGISLFHHFLHYAPWGASEVRSWLTPRLAYLKMGSSSFPRKFYELWHSERAAYLEEVKDVPLANTTEQVKALSDLYERLSDALESAETDRGKAMLANSMVKTMAGLFTLTRDPSFKLPAPSDVAD